MFSTRCVCSKQYKKIVWQRMNQSWTMSLSVAYVILLGVSSAITLFQMGVHVAPSLVFFLVAHCSLTINHCIISCDLQLFNFQFISVRFSWISRGQYEWHTCCCLYKLAVRIDLLPIGMEWYWCRYGDSLDE